MFSSRRTLRLEFQIVWFTAGVLIMGLATAIPAAAQKPEQGSSVPCDRTEPISEYLKTQQANPKSSLTSYCIAEVSFYQRNYQTSVNAYRDALRGDGYPSWTKVWSHIQMGKIFDVTGQRDRAVKEYLLAVQTGDNTRRAIDEARKLLQSAYPWPKAHHGSKDSGLGP